MDSASSSTPSSLVSTRPPRRRTSDATVPNPVDSMPARAFSMLVLMPSMRSADAARRKRWRNVPRRSIAASTPRSRSDLASSDRRLAARCRSIRRQPLRQPVDRIAVARARPVDDVRGDADQRQRLVAQLLERFAGFEEYRLRTGEEPGHPFRSQTRPRARARRARVEAAGVRRGLHRSASVVGKQPVQSGVSPYRRRGQEVENGPGSSRLARTRAHGLGAHGRPRGQQL